jgi:succinate-semialdehyde dehydrogenase/glutarate-semialdehyde dehydrogenase
LTSADSGGSIKVNNPATGEILGSVPDMGAAEAKRAVEAADRAWPTWREDCQGRARSSQVVRPDDGEPG